MSKDEFMEKWFTKLNTDCQSHIIKKIIFFPKDMFNINDVININHNVNVVITHEPIYDEGYEDWIYQCNRKIKCCGCDITTETIFFELHKQLITKKIELTCKSCKSCKNPLCPTCYFKESGSWKGMCNTCIWFDLG